MADQSNRVLAYTSYGDYQLSFGSYGTGDGEFDLPSGIAINASGHVYVADGINGRVEIFTQTGQYLYQLGSYGVGEGQFFSVPTNCD